MSAAAKLDLPRRRRALHPAFLGALTCAAFIFVFSATSEAQAPDAQQ
jgi:hypothetical protein